MNVGNARGLLAWFVPSVIALGCIAYVYRFPVGFGNLSLFRVSGLLVGSAFFVRLLSTTREQACAMLRRLLLPFCTVCGITVIVFGEVAFRSLPPAYASDASVQTLNVLILLLVVAYIDTRDVLVRVLYAYVLFSYVEAALAVNALITGQLAFSNLIAEQGAEYYSDLQLVNESDGLRRLTGTFFDPNFYGVYLCTVVAFASWLLMHGSRSRAVSARRDGDGVAVALEDGRILRGSHCLLTVGMVPNTGALGLDEAGITLDKGGFIPVDRVSRTSVPGVYAAGDCTGVQMLASVAAMQGRIAMWHSLGDAVQPLHLSHVAMTVFTEPEIASVGVSQQAVEAGAADALAVNLPLATNARAKMQGFRDGFVKLFARRSSGVVLGGVVVAPRASELILAVSLAVEQHVTVDEMAHTFAVYPSLSGSITEAARRLMQPEYH